VVLVLVLLLDFVEDVVLVELDFVVVELDFVVVELDFVVVVLDFVVVELDFVVELLVLEVELLNEVDSEIEVDVPGSFIAKSTHLEIGLLRNYALDQMGQRTIRMFGCYHYMLLP
jgi:hypothetical protein